VPETLHPADKATLTLSPLSLALFTMEE
jgi:hypothetical protein